MSRLWHSLQDRYNQWIESFSYLSEKDREWIGRSRAESDILAFPKSCSKMVLIPVVGISLTPIVVLSSIGAIIASIYIANNLSSLALGISIALIIDIASLIALVLSISTFIALIKLLKSYFLLLIRREYLVVQPAEDGNKKSYDKENTKSNSNEMDFIGIN